MARWSLYSQKIFYKAALDANDIPPEITRRLGAWAQVAGDTPYSRLNEAKIDEARKRITNSNNRFLEITWWTKMAKHNGTEEQDNHSQVETTKSLVPTMLEHGDQRPQLNTKITPLSSAFPFTTIYPEITLAFEICYHK